MTELLARVDMHQVDPADYSKWVDLLDELEVDVERVLSVFEVVRVERGNWDAVELRLRECVLTEDGHKQVRPDDPHEVWTKPLDVLVPDDMALPI